MNFVAFFFCSFWPPWKALDVPGLYGPLFNTSIFLKEPLYGVCSGSPAYWTQRKEAVRFTHPFGIFCGCRKNNVCIYALLYYWVKYHVWYVFQKTWCFLSHVGQLPVQPSVMSGCLLCVNQVGLKIGNLFLKTNTHKCWVHHWSSAHANQGKQARWNDHVFHKPISFRIIKAKIFFSDVQSFTF